MRLAERRAVIAADRLAGLSWRQIAEKYGYANPESVAQTYRPTVIQRREREARQRVGLVRLAQDLRA
jgi:hypothetical protein